MGHLNTHCYYFNFLQNQSNGPRLDIWPCCNMYSKGDVDKGVCMDRDENKFSSTDLYDETGRSPELEINYVYL